MKADTGHKKMGRPREFDPAEALEKALGVFLRLGYEGTSLTDLTDAVGVTRPSLYAAFGNKEALFNRVVELYVARSAPTRAALDIPCAREAIETLLTRYVDTQTAPGSPHGCLVVHGALAGCAENDTIRQTLNSLRSEGEGMLHCRLKRAQAEGDLPADIDASELARFYSTVSQGLAVQAVGGASRDQLHGVIRTAMRAWPG